MRFGFAPMICRRRTSISRWCSWRIGLPSSNPTSSMSGGCKPGTWPTIFLSSSRTRRTAGIGSSAAFNCCAMTACATTPTRPCFTAISRGCFNIRSAKISMTPTCATSSVWPRSFKMCWGDGPIFKELLHPTTPEARERVRKLREVYKMDPAIVQKVDEEYGPLDWRLPDAHAIYWAEIGRLNAKPEDQETLRRSIYQSMQQATFRGGALSSSITNVTEQNFLLWPNLDLVPKVNAAYEKMIAEEVRNPHGFQQNMQTAHKNFLKQAIYLLYEDNREKQAAYWFKYLNTIYPNAFVGKEAHITLENFAISQIIEDNGETDMSKVSASIMGMIHRSFFYLIADNDDKAYNYRNLAQRIWNHYHAKTEGVSEQRLALKPFPEMYRFVLDRELNPTNGILSAQGAALLRTKLGLRAGEMAPPPSAPAKP